MVPVYFVTQAPGLYHWGPQRGETVDEGNAFRTISVDHRPIPQRARVTDGDPRPIPQRVRGQGWWTTVGGGRVRNGEPSSDRTQKDATKDTPRAPYAGRRLKAPRGLIGRTWQPVVRGDVI